MNAQNAPPLAGLPDTRPRAYEAAHRALARRAAAESIVLLQNEGTVWRCTARARCRWSRAAQAPAT